MISVGVIGLGPNWATLHRPALATLRDRVRVAVVADAVPLRASSAARAVGCGTAGGLLEVARRKDVRAVLLLDPAWWGLHALELLLPAGKPIFLGGSVGREDTRLNELTRTAAAAGATVMPEFGPRYTPATIRLRELAATALGPPHRLTVSHTLPDAPPLAEAYGQRPAAEVLRRWADWCAHLLAGTVAEVRSRSADGGRTDAAASVTGLQFSPAANMPAAEAVIELRPAGDGEDVAEAWTVRVECAAGEATLRGPDRIEWTVDGETHADDLGGERTAYALMLDLFHRRAVGGLVPVPDLSDLTRSLRLVRAAEESRTAGRPVTLAPPPPGL